MIVYGARLTTPPLTTITTATATTTTTGSIYVSQSLNCKRPVFVGDSVTATMTIVKKEGYKNKGDLLTCNTVVCSDESGSVVINGEAKVLLPYD